MIRSRSCFSVVVLITLAACSDPANDAGANDTGDVVAAESAVLRENMSEWVQPPVGELPRRSEEEKKLGVELGRALPEPEFLQPPLDESLAAFSPQLDPDISATFTGGASDVLPGLVHSWIDAFNEYYPNVQIEIGTPYAGSLGMLEVIDGNYDFVFVSRELKPTDVSSFSRKYGYPPLSVPVSGASYRHYGFLDAIGFFVHVDNPLDRLSFHQIDRLYSQTHHRGGESITTWGELGLKGEWSDKPVHLYGIAPWNGFEEFVRQRVLSIDDKRGEWRDDISFSKTAFSVAEDVANDPLGIGYTGLAYLTGPVKILPLSNPGVEEEYIPASYERVADATYPLSRLIYFNFNRNPDLPVNPVIEEFLRFILSRDGQQLVLDQAVYLPLRSTQVDDSIELLGGSGDG